MQRILHALRTLFFLDNDKNRESTPRSTSTKSPRALRSTVQSPFQAPSTRSSTNDPIEHSPNPSPKTEIPPALGPTKAGTPRSPKAKTLIGGSARAIRRGCALSTASLRECFSQPLLGGRSKSLDRVDKAAAGLPEVNSSGTDGEQRIKPKTSGCCGLGSGKIRDESPSDVDEADQLAK